MSFAKYLSVILASMLKFVGGPIVGLSLKITWIETAICTVIGMMLTIIVIIYSGDYLSLLWQRIFKNTSKKKTFTKTNRLAVKTRRKFGLIGIALLTPILFTPIGGAILSIAFRYDKHEILAKMLISAVSWSIVQTLFFYYVKDLIFKE